MRRPLATPLIVVALAIWSSVMAALMLAPQAHALSSIAVNDAADRIDVSAKSEFYTGRGDNLQVDMAAVEGVTGRMAVRAARAGSNPSWMVFALQNTTNKTQVRWIVAERYAVIGSGIIWPDLDSRRIEAITPSIGFLPERLETDRADVFRVSLEPGQIITFAAELSVDRPQQITMWQPLAYQLKLRERQLFNGVLLGIAGLLGVFLTAIFAANHRAIFPSAALVAWCVLAYLCVDFGYWHKLLQIKSEDNAVWRAATEAAMAASLVIFLVIYLRLGAWFSFVRMIAGVWIAASLALVFIAVLDPRLAATFARVSFAVIGGIGGLAILVLVLGGQDRAIHLAPVWLLFLVWVFGAGMALANKLTGDIVVPSLTASLVLIVVLMGFVVTQFAFHTPDGHHGRGSPDQTIRSLAVEGSGAAVFEWHSRRDEINVEPVVEASLGLASGELSAKAEHFLGHLHSADRERLRAQLATLKETAGLALKSQFRLRHADNSYRWFDLEASRVETTDRRGLRYVGLVRDITDDKRAVERLMHDAVHCSLTGLPNRELFLDRLGVAVGRTGPDGAGPAVLFIDIDKFKSVNSSYGIVVGDSLLMTLSRRLGQQLGRADTLARIGGDQFAVLIPDEHDPHRLAALAESVRRAIRSPIKIAGHDVVLTGAIGIAVHDGESGTAEDLLREAEIAMYRAKQGGADKIEIFAPGMRGERDDRVAIESELRKAIEAGQIKVLYQPIVYLPTEELAGFEALVRWEHPRLGVRNPADFVAVAEESDLIVKLGSFVLQRAVAEAQKWQRHLPRSDNPLFVSVNVSSRQLLGNELVQDVRNIQSRGLVPDGVLRLEITEQLVMQNPEQAAETLAALRAGGARLALDDFGTGYSSLAYLSRFAVDAIKLDRDFVQASSGDGPNAVIVRSMIAMAHELGMKVVAEGVEEEEDARFLRSIGCEYAQGYYYGEPMQTADVIDMLKVVARAERKLARRGLFRRKPQAADAATAPAADSGTTVSPGGDRGKGRRPGAGADQPVDAGTRLNGAVAPERSRSTSRPVGAPPASGVPHPPQPASPLSGPLPPAVPPTESQPAAANRPAAGEPRAPASPLMPVSHPSLNGASPHHGAPVQGGGPPRPVAPLPGPPPMPPQSRPAGPHVGSDAGNMPRSPSLQAAVPSPPEMRQAVVPPAPPPAPNAPVLMSPFAPAGSGEAREERDGMADQASPADATTQAGEGHELRSTAARAHLENLRTLPPGIAASLARLAGVPFAGDGPATDDGSDTGAADPQDGETDADDLDAMPPEIRPPLSRRA